MRENSFEILSEKVQYLFIMANVGKSLVIIIFILSFMYPEDILTAAKKEIELKSPYRHNGRNKKHKKSANKKHHNYYERKTVSIKDHAIVNGEYLETSRILIQKETQRGVEYFPYGEHKEPVFIRKEKEFNKKYIIFQDPYLPPGEGYLVVLKRIPPRTEASGMPSNIQSWEPTEVSYEAFHLLLSNNVHGSVDRLNVRRLAYRIRTKFSGRKNARTKFEQKRKKLAHERRRFALGTWRGKRSVSMTFEINAGLQFIEPHANLSLVFKEKTSDNFSEGKIKLGTSGACKMNPLNMKEVKLKMLNQLKVNEPPNYDILD